MRLRMPYLRLRPRLNLNLGIVCGVLVLVPALIGAELITQGYERRITEDVRRNATAGLDSLSGLFESDVDQLKVHMRHLREKLERNPSAPEYLLTLRGVGYKLTEP